jgi:hypothetical protein
MSRLTDQDRRFGRITYGRSNWAAFRAVFRSGDDEESRNSLTVNAFGWIARIWLPAIIHPHKVKCTAKYWDAATIERMGRDWYYEVFPRDFGFCFSDGHVSIYYGQQTNDSRSTKQRGWFLPWKQWRHVRHSLYGADGTLFWEWIKKRGNRGAPKFEEQWEAEKSCSSVAFSIRDQDGKEVTATTRIEEREWRRGEKWCKWLSLFYRPKIRRSLDISFSAEVGLEKGTWKGGMVGTSIEMLPGELHEAAMRRWCAMEHRDKYGAYMVSFIGVATETEAA